MIGTDYAFPVSGDEPRQGCEGLTKREYVATKAMQGLAANSAYSNDMFATTAMHAVQMADALLAELAKS